MTTTPHIPVLLEETINALNPAPGKTFIDGTLGAGGHTAALLRATAPDGRVIAFDRDWAAIGIASKRLEDFGDRVTIIHAPYTDIQEVIGRSGTDQVDGVLLDLGFSSMQIDTPERGFSFQADGPLDMRYDTSSGMTAGEILNTWHEDEIANLIYKYGEDRLSRRIAKVIVQNRPLHTTTQLADLINKSIRSKEKIHPATRTFQALRIAVNGELDHVSAVLPQAIDLLKPGGRLAVISFHSLEDRIVKTFIRDSARTYRDDPDNPYQTVDLTPTLTPITRKPVTASDDEIRSNPRARSAKLRVAERV